MATQTPNLGLTLPIGTENVSRQVINDNNTIIDTAVGDTNGAIAKLQEGLAIIVDGDTCSVAVPVGGYAYIKNNTHSLTEGLYKNTSASAFPTSGGTADNTVFTAVSGGGLNAIIEQFAISDTANYTEHSPASVPANSSYTAPKTGWYVVGCISTTTTSAIWYLDSNRTQVLLASGANTTTYTIILLKEGTTLYTRSGSTYSYNVNGYYQI